ERELSQQISPGTHYSALFHTYRKVASIAGATSLRFLWMARFSGHRTFALLSAKSAKGTLSAGPAGTRSRSARIRLTISLCFPFRPWGTSTCAMVVKFIAPLLVRGLIGNFLREEKTLNKRNAIVLSS